MRLSASHSIPVGVRDGGYASGLRLGMQPPAVSPMSGRVWDASARSHAQAPSLRERSRLPVAALAAAAPEAQIPTEPVAGTNGSTAAAPHLNKGDYVRGIVEALTDAGALVRLEAGGVGHLAWSNFSKLHLPKDIDMPSLLSPGESIWAMVSALESQAAANSGPAVKLSTAALELRPGDMMKQRRSVYQTMEQWHDEWQAPNAAPGAKLSFNEWRGQKELNAFLSSKPSQQAKSQRSRRSLMSRHRDPSAWGLITKPQPTVGDLVVASVSGVKRYGVFVELDRERDALIPASQVSRAFVSETELAGLIRPGDRVTAAILKVEPKGSKQEEGGDKSKAKASGLTGLAVRGSIEGREGAGGLLTSPDYGTIPDDVRYVLSMRLLEASEGLLASKGLQEFNSQAVQVHERLQRQDVERHLAAAAGDLDNFRSDLKDWREGSFQVPSQSIVRGLVTSVQINGAFVRLEHGPTAFLHEDSVSRAKFRRMSDVFKVGDTVYGRVYDRPTNSKQDQASASPGSYWLSVKDLETKAPGQLLRDPDAFWRAADGKYRQQETQPKQSPESITMHRCDLDLRQLVSSAQRLEQVPWHMLAGRPNPGILSMGHTGPGTAAAAAGASGTGAAGDKAAAQPQGRAAPAPESWSRQYTKLAGQYKRVVRDLAQGAAEVLPAGVADLVQGAASSDDGEPGSSGSADRLAAFAKPIGPELRHAWWSLRGAAKAAVAKMALLQLRAEAVQMAEALNAETASSSGTPDAASSQPQQGANAAEEQRHRVQMAAAKVVFVARLLRKPEASQLVREAYGIVRTLGVPLPQAALDSLLLLGSALLEDAVDKGATTVRDSGVMEILAAEGVQPSKEWCEAAFRQLYKCMVTDVQPREVAKYFRLMHAMGYCPSSLSWWDRMLQQLFYNNAVASTADRLLPRDTDLLREAIGAVYSLGQGSKKAKASAAVN